MVAVVVIVVVVVNVVVIVVVAGASVGAVVGDFDGLAVGLSVTRQSWNDPDWNLVIISLSNAAVSSHSVLPYRYLEAEQPISCVTAVSAPGPVNALIDRIRAELVCRHDSRPARSAKTAESSRVAHWIFPGSPGHFDSSLLSSNAFRSQVVDVKNWTPYTVMHWKLAICVGLVDGDELGMLVGLTDGNELGESVVGL